MVPVSGQLLVILDMVPKPKIRNFSLILISEYLQPVQVQIDSKEEMQNTNNSALW
jgi:hypothetical protein